MILFPNLIERLTQELVSRGQDSDVQSLVFKRLFPLLPLRVMTLDSFAKHSSFPLFPLLYRRAFSCPIDDDTNIRLEFDQVRRLSAELLCRFPPAISLHFLISQISPHLSNSLFFADIKVLMFYLNGLISIHGISKIWPDIALILDLVNQILALDVNEDPDGVKMQMGAAELIALMSYQSLKLESDSQQSYVLTNVLKRAHSLLLVCFHIISSL